VEEIKKLLYIFGRRFHIQFTDRTKRWAMNPSGGNCTKYYLRGPYNGKVRGKYSLEGEGEYVASSKTLYIVKMLKDLAYD